MSIAELYIENGIDPTDPNSMDDFLSRYEEYEISPVCIVSPLTIALALNETSPQEQLPPLGHSMKAS